MGARADTVTWIIHVTATEVTKLTTFDLRSLLFCLHLVIFPTSKLRGDSTIDAPGDSTECERGCIL